MPQRDEFDDPEGFFSRLITVKDQARTSVFDNKSLVFSGVVFLAVVALSGVIWASYPTQNPLTADGGMPIIRADQTAYKVVPEDRGGMLIAHRDSTVFDAMRAPEAGNQRVENLLDDTPEKPMDRAALFAGLKTDLAEPKIEKGPQVARMGDLTQDRPLTEAERRDQAAERNKDMLEEKAPPLPGSAPEVPATVAKDVLEAPEVKPAVTAEPEAEPETSKPSKGLQEKPALSPKPVVAEKPSKPEAKPAPAALAVKTGVGKAYVQVASVPSEGQVKSEWGVVSGKLPMLQGLPYRTQRADLGAKGVFHRIQVGPMSGDDAAKLCAAIKVKKPGGCLVVK
jgi:hypothetical protein